jgi:hypothetical protein
VHERTIFAGICSADADDDDDDDADRGDMHMPENRPSSGSGSGSRSRSSPPCIGGGSQPGGQGYARKTSWQNRQGRESELMHKLWGGRDSPEAPSVPRAPKGAGAGTSTGPAAHDLL